MAALHDDLYAVLGVGLAATDEEIRGAYKTKAKMTHPDVGGSNEDFARLKRAHDVLLDPQRRFHYDATGKIIEPEPDNEMTEIGSVLTDAFHIALQNCENLKQEPENMDLVAAMRAALKGKRQGLNEAIKACEEGRTSMGRLVGRFETTRDENFLDGMVRFHISMCDHDLVAMRGKLLLIDKAEEFLKAFRFRQGAAATPQSFQRTMKRLLEPRPMPVQFR